MRDGCITVAGARETNLKNITIDFSYHEVTAVVGVSGSGKSSLLFRTLSDESYARHLLHLARPRRNHRPRWPNVDRIEGLPFCQTVSQGSLHRNPRSTVATFTGLHAVFRRLTRIHGEIQCKCGNIVGPTRSEQLLSFLEAKHKGKQVRIGAIIDREPLQNLSKIEVDLAREKVRIIELQALPWVPRKERTLKGLGALDPNQIHAIFTPIATHRVLMKEREALVRDISRGFDLGSGGALITIQPEKNGQKSIEIDTDLQAICEDCYEIHNLPSDPLLSFNSAPERSGRCGLCEGIGSVEEVSIDSLITHPDNSITDNCFALMRERGSYKYLGIREDVVRGVCAIHGESINVPFKSLGSGTKDAILFGMGDTRVLPIDSSGKKSGAKVRYHGLIPTLTKLASDSSNGVAKEYARTFVMNKVCGECHGSRFDNEALDAFRYRGKRFTDLMTSSVDDCYEFLRICLSQVSDDEKLWVISGIRVLESLSKAGLGYLGMERSTSTLSGGELKRIKIAASLHEGIVRCCYILDEPSLGLHASDIVGLVKLVSSLREAGNTILLADHNPNMISVASRVVTLGPGAGASGGEVMSPGLIHKTLRRVGIKRNKLKLNKKRAISVHGVNIHNIHGTDVTIPLGGMVCLTGVSGSGKSSFAHNVLYPAVRAYLASGRCTGPSWKDFVGGKFVRRIERLGQQPIGTSVTSILATYLGIFDAIREKYANTELARSRSYLPAHFSFNRSEGRCPTCNGRGVVIEEMNFDNLSQCPHCAGSRYIDAVLEVNWKGVNIGDLLGLNVSESLVLFADEKSIHSPLQLLVELGLGYLQLGRPTLTLSGGEAQRLKLATSLNRFGDDSDGVIFILDEPTAGLHQSDVSVLLNSFDRILSGGDNTLIVIEHNLDLIAQADWLVDFGPGAGQNGGKVVFAGTPEEAVKYSGSRTGDALGRVVQKGKRQMKPHKKHDLYSGYLKSEDVTERIQKSANQFQNALRKMDFLTDEDDVNDLAVVSPSYVVETEPSSFSADATLLDCLGLAERFNSMLLRHVEFSPVDECEIVADKEEALSIVRQHRGKVELGFSPLTALLHAGEATATKALEILDNCYRRGFERCIIEGEEHNLANLSGDKLYARDLYTMRVITDKVSESDDVALCQVENALKAGQGWAVILQRNNGKLYETQLTTRPLSLSEHRIGRQRLVPGLLDKRSDGGCPYCEGTGRIETYTQSLLIADSRRSVLLPGFMTAEALDLIRPIQGRLIKTLQFLREEGVVDLVSTGALKPNLKTMLLYGYPWARFLMPGRSGKKDTDYFEWQGLMPIFSKRIHLARNKEWRNKVEASRKEIDCVMCKGSGFDWQTRRSVVFGKGVPELIQNTPIDYLIWLLREKAPLDNDCLVMEGLADIASAGMGTLFLGSRVRDLDRVDREKIRAIALQYVHFAEATYALKFESETSYQAVTKPIAIAAKNCRVSIMTDNMPKRHA